MSYNREGINAHVREFFDDRLFSKYIQRTPLLYMMGFRKAAMAGKLGQPNASVIWGGQDLGDAEIAHQLNGKERYFTYQKQEPDDGGNVEYRGSTRTASGFAEDNAGQIVYRCNHIQEPMKIGKHSLNWATGESAIGSLLDRSSAPVWNKFLKRNETLMWRGGTNANGSVFDMNSASAQDKELWDEPLGLVYAIGTQNNYLGKVDRSVETNLNPFSYAAGTVIGDTTLVELDINRSINNGFVRNDTSVEVAGMANSNPNGVGCDLFITTSSIFNELAAQADARGIEVNMNGIPNHSTTGVRFPLLAHDNVYYTWDAGCPSGSMYCLDLSTILLETDRQANFTWSGFTDKAKTEEGGEYYEWGNYEAMYRLCYKDIYLNGVITGLASS